MGVLPMCTESRQPGMPPFINPYTPSGMTGMSMAPHGAMRGAAFGAAPAACGMQMDWRPGMGQMMYPPWRSDRASIKKPLKRKERDPNRVPRPKSTYNFFMKAMVGRLKREHPTAAHKEAFKEAARLWMLSPRDGSTPVDTSNFGGPPSAFILTDDMKEALRSEAAGTGSGSLAQASASAPITGVMTTGAEAGIDAPTSAMNGVDEPAEEEGEAKGEEETEGKEEGAVPSLAPPPPVGASSEASQPQAEASDSTVGQLPTSEDGSEMTQDVEQGGDEQGGVGQGGEAAKRVKADHEDGHPESAELWCHA